MHLLLIVSICFVLPASLTKAYLTQEEGGDEEMNEENNLAVQDEIRPWLILPIPVHPISKKALTILSRWRPLDSYIEAAATAVAASVSGPTTLDFITAETRGQGRKIPRQRNRVQPLRWGRRKRVVDCC